MNEQLIISFKQKLLKGQAVFGPFMKTCDPAFAEAAGYAGMDFAILDMEHGPIKMCIRDRYRIPPSMKL